MIEDTQDVMVCRQVCVAADALKEIWLNNNTSDNQKAIMSLTISQQRMLRVVWQMTSQAPNGIILRDLAKQLHLSSSAVSVMVDYLVQKGCLIRVTQPDDRRKVLIRLSEENMQYVSVAENGYIPLMKKFRQQCDAEKMKCFEEVLSELNNFLIENQGD